MIHSEFLQHKLPLLFGTIVIVKAVCNCKITVEHFLASMFDGHTLALLRDEVKRENKKSEKNFSSLMCLYITTFSLIFQDLK